MTRKIAPSDTRNEVNGTALRSYGWLTREIHEQSGRIVLRIRDIKFDKSWSAALPGNYRKMSNFAQQFRLVRSSWSFNQNKGERLQKPEFVRQPTYVISGSPYQEGQMRHSGHQMAPWYRRLRASSSLNQSLVRQQANDLLQ